MKTCKYVVTQVVVIIVVCALGYLPVQAATSKTFFMPRSVNSMTFLHPQHTHVKKKQPGLQLEPNRPRWFGVREKKKKAVASGNFSVTSFYQESTNRKNLARYFFPHNKTELQIAGATAQNVQPDISGTWLMLAGRNTVAIAANNVAGHNYRFSRERHAQMYLNEYQSKIRIRPNMKQYGINIKAHYAFPSISSRLWSSFNIPIIQSVHNINLTEFNQSNEFSDRNDIGRFVIQANTGAGYRTLKNEERTIQNRLNAHEAFNHPYWKYGKLGNGITKAGFSDLLCHVGYQLNDNWDVYTKLTAPLSHKPKAEYMFEPLLGNGGHTGLGGGIQFTGNLQELFDVATQQCTFTSCLDYQYLLKNKQMRSFDLTSHGQWSRYLQVFDRFKGRFVLEPGINYLTRRVEVEPRHEITWNNRFTIQATSWLNLSFGYNTWYKHKEEITLPSWHEHIHIASRIFLNPVLEELMAASNAITINNHINDVAGGLAQAPPDETNEIQQADFNIKSAQHPTTYSHTLFMQASTHGEINNQLYGIQAGFHYEIASANKALDKWGINLQLSLQI